MLISDSTWLEFHADAESTRLCLACCIGKPNSLKSRPLLLLLLTSCNTIQHPLNVLIQYGDADVGLAKNIQYSCILITTDILYNL